jgi:hypothetical protein
MDKKTKEFPDSIGASPKNPSQARGYGPALPSGKATFDGIEEYDAAIGTIFNPEGAAPAKSAGPGAQPGDGRLTP